ncbi:Derlin-2 isoform 1 [Schistosoma japonicum]|uniref:Derlin n=2 Tax=Schistosoma japonicum TaxID=6182 RepID=Q86F97_SCHJA|nr:similar to XM_028438 CGI-101 protein in Homo sapiens [Schistosoma japonicum]KAH8854284.1 Derlin-2 [Schistosoma japonicum]TNN05644.1 Derlin-2 isoform 1 [Schistosoma japonicum]
MDIIAQEISNTPPVTSAYIATCLILTVAVQLNLISPFQLYFNPSLIANNFQLWRLVTSFCFFGSFNFSFVFNILFAYRYCRMLEETWYSTKTADFIMMFLFCGTLTLIIAFFVNMLFLSHVLTMMLVYVWSRRNPLVRLNIFGIIEVNAPYLPWVFFAFSFLLGNNMMVDLIGIFVGHLYYFLEDVYPNQVNGFRILRTPEFMKYLFNRRHINRGYEPLPEVGRPGGFDWNGQE